MKKILSSFIICFLLYSCSVMTTPKSNSQLITKSSKVSKAPKAPKSSIEKPEIKKSDEVIKKLSEFPINKIATYYSVPFTIFKIEEVDNKGVHHPLDISKNEIEKSYLGKIVKIEDLEANPQQYLDNLQIRYQRRNYNNLSLSQQHINLLDALLSKTNKNNNKLALIFVNGYSLKAYEQHAASIEKAIYAQYVTDYLYATDDKIRVEKRYVANIPEDELFIVILGFEGKVPYNAYNAPKLDSIQWLQKYLDYDYKQVARNEDKNQKINDILNKATSSPEGVNSIDKDSVKVNRVDSKAK